MTKKHTSPVLLLTGFEDEEEELPPCSTLTVEEKGQGIECTNTTDIIEIRYNDPVFERLIAQLWMDYQTKMNTAVSLYGK